MATPFMSEVRIFTFPFAPKGWAKCDGQVLPIAQNQALFSLLGTTYGGNGVQTFALPDLRGRAPMHFGNGSGLSPYSLGEVAGQEAVTLLSTQIPPHTHTVNCNNTSVSQLAAVGGVWGKEPNGNKPFAAAPTPNTFLKPSAISNAGGSQPHNNMQPGLVLNFCIALVGVFPSRN